MYSFWIIRVLQPSYSDRIPDWVGDSVSPLVLRRLVRCYATDILRTSSLSLTMNFTSTYLCYYYAFFLEASSLRAI
jgi:hypothetical protein